MFGNYLFFPQSQRSKKVPFPGSYINRRGGNGMHFNPFHELNEGVIEGAHLKVKSTAGWGWMLLEGFFARVLANSSS